MSYKYIRKNMIGSLNSNMCNSIKVIVFILLTFTFSFSSVKAQVLNYVGSMGGSSYYISDIPMTWTAADSICTSNNGYLIAINSQQESDFIDSLLNGLDAYWLGLLDGNTVWQNGSPVAFTNYDATYVQGQYGYIYMQTNGFWDNSPNDGNIVPAGIFALMESPCPPSVTLTGTNASAFGTNDGEAIASVLSGVGPFTYFWENLSTSIPAYGPTTTSAFTDTFFNAPSGTYTLALIDAGCPGTFLLDTITISGSGGTLSYNGSLNLCGVSTTDITVYFNGCTASNANLGNQYVLSDGVSTLLDSTVLLDSMLLPNLGAGIYYLSVLNYDNGCIAIDTFTVTTNSLPVSVVSTNYYTASNAGSVCITVLGGVSPYTIFWDNGSGGQVLPTWTSGDTLTNLTPGTYTFFISDGSTPACQATGSVDIVYGCSAQLINNYTVCDETIFLDASMSMVGAGSYSYDYTLTDGNNTLNTISSTNDTITFSSPISNSGQYYLTVTEINTGCVATDSITITLTPLTVTSTVNNITSLGLCNGSVFVTPTSPGFPFSFQWDTNGTIFSTNAGWNTGITNLCANTYCLNITDINGCTYQECFDVEFIPCDANLSVFDSIDCYGGLGILQATIDTLGLPLGPISFLGDRYVFYLTNVNTGGPPTIQQSNLPSFIFPNLTSGLYVLQIEDRSYNSFCSSDSVLLTQPDPIAIYITVDSTSAPWIADGQITIDSITGGTAPYNVTWLGPNSTALTTTGILQQDSLAYANQFTSGYQINVIDTNGCGGALVDIYIHPQRAADSLYIDSSYAINPTCFGDCNGFLWAKFKNIGTYAIPPFTFYWLDDQGNTIVVDSLGTPWYNPSHIASFNGAGNLACAGSYTLHAYDFYGNGPVIENFVLTQPDSMYIHMYPPITIDCGEDTLLTPSAHGGNRTNDTILISQNILTVTNSSAVGFADTLITGGDYLLVVRGNYTDTAGANYDAGFDYTNVPGSSANAVSHWTLDGNTVRPTPDIYNSSHVYNYPFTGNGIHQFAFFNPGQVYSGSLIFELYRIAIDTVLYNYAWSTNPPSTPFIISINNSILAYPGLTPTDYIFTVTDHLGCSVADTVNVSWDLEILNFANIHLASAFCYGDSSGTVVMSADTSIGFAPYSYILNNQVVNDTVIDVPGGSHVVSIIDNLGCISADSTITINQPDSLFACGMDTILVPIPQDAFTMTLDTAFSYTTVPTQLGLAYKLVVTGTYRDTWGSHYKDAAFQYNVTPKVPISNWGWTGSPSAGQRPAPDVYDNTHQYTYYFTGDGGSQTFSYTDGIYYDNDGSLTFEMYKLVCSNVDTSYSCYGDSTAISSVYPTGGTPFDPDGIPNSGDEYYEYSWESMTTGIIWSTNQFVISLPSDSFTVTISDSLGCTYERKLYVEQSSSPLQADTILTQDILCKHDSTGKITAYVSGGYMSNLAVLILGTDTIFTASGDLDTVVVDTLKAGQYDLYLYDTIPDAVYGIYGCVEHYEINILEPQDALSSTVNLLDHVECFGDSTGKASANVIGGQFPYLYAWDNGEMTATADSLWAGWQAITFTDANGCTLRDSINIEHINNEIIGVGNPIQNVSCFGGCDGIYSIASSGGVLPHTYFWDIGQVSINMPDTAFNLCYGGHDVVIEDAIGCRATHDFNITEPSQILAQAIGDGNTTPNGPLTQPVSCYGFNDGTAYGTATGGTPPYTYVWDSINGQAGQFAINLTPGVHTLYVTDAEGCTASDTVVITEPNPLVVVIDSSMTVYSYCNGTNSGQLCAIASGGTEPYSYVWNDILGQTTACATNLTGDQIYTVIVMDERNCIATVSYDLDSITNSMTPSGVSMTVNDVSCFGIFDGSIDINSVTGGVPGYTYAWTGPSGYVSSLQNISSLYAGSYACIIIDTNGCAITVNAELEEPDELIYNTYNVIGSTCDGACNGQIWVDIQGGTSPYSYDVFETGVFPLMNTSPVINDSIIPNLCHGLHSIYITDGNNCEGNIPWNGGVGAWQEFVDTGVVVYVDGVNTTQTTCHNSNDGTATVINPDPLFTYTWETTSGVVIDTGITTSILAPGIYNLVAHYTDSLSFGQPYTGCDVEYQFTITASASAVSFAGNITHVSCYDGNDGSINITPSGGTPPFAWQWDTTTSTPPNSSQLNNQNINNLIVGTYTVTVTDASGCTFTNSFDVTEPDVITAVILPPTHVSCNGGSDGSATIVPSGGTGGHSYQPNIWVAAGGGLSATASGLTAGDYTVTVTDASGCSKDFTVTIEEPNSIIDEAYVLSFYGENPNSANPGPYNVSCNGASDGSAIVTTGAGTPPYTYSWNTNPIQTNSTATNLSVGTYTITVTDDEGCTDSETITIEEPDPIVLTPNQSPNQYGFDIDCYGGFGGPIWVEVEGGSPYPGDVNNPDEIYDHSWSGNLGGQSNTYRIDNIPAGSYTVIVTDSEGCSDNISFTLTEPTEPFVADVITVNYTGPEAWNYTVDFEDQTNNPSGYDIQHTFNWDGDSLFISSSEVMNINQTQFSHTFGENTIGINEVYVSVENLSTGCTDFVGPIIIEVQGIRTENVFTPNNDAYNNTFDFSDHAMQTMVVEVYNRWGQLVYQWEGGDKSWDGTGTDGRDLPEGVYFYIMTAKGVDGKEYNEEGSVTLIR